MLYKENSRVYKKSKDKSFQQPITQFMSDGTSMVSDVMSHGISMGEAYGQGIQQGYSYLEALIKKLLEQ